MKMTKRIFSLALVLIMMVCMATSVFAADIVNDTTHAYKAYQIFRGEQDGSNSILTDADWGNGVNPAALIDALKTANPELYEDVDAYSVETSKETANQVIKALLADGGGADYHADADEFANIVVNYIVAGNGINIAADATTVDLPAGYYVIVDQSENLNNDAKNPALLQLTNKGKVWISKKYNVPTLEKEIENGVTKTVGQYAIGDTVEFSLTGTVANNLEDFDAYKVVFHDRMSDGLTFNTNSVVVTVGETPIPTDAYTVVTGACSKHTDCTFQVVFDDILIKPVDENGNPLISNNAEIVVKYTAVVDDDALIDEANPNEAALEFSNDPDWEKPTTGGTPPTGITPWDKVKVYTTEVGLTKKDENTGKILTGAEFTLEGEATNIVLVSSASFEPWDENSKGDKYWELTDGSYTDTDPSTVSDKKDYVDVDVVYEMVVVENEIQTTHTGEKVKAKAFVGEDGKLKFTGLKAGTYTLTETVVPTNYNSIDPITLVVGFDINKEEFTYDWSWPGGKSFGTTAQITVFNTTGSVLPETGGVGTTMFYVLGSVLVLGAAVLLIAKKRSGASD